MSNFNRRHLLASFGAAAALAGGAIAQAAHAERNGQSSPGASVRRADVDPALRKLEAAFNAEWRKYLAAREVLDAAEKRFDAARPPQPHEPPLSDEVANRFRVALFHGKDHPDFAALSEHSDAVGKRHAEWRAACDAAAHRTGFAEAEDRYDHRQDAADVAAGRVKRFRARSFADIQVKMRVHRKWYFEADAFLPIIAADLARVTKANRVSRDTRTVTA